MDAVETYSAEDRADALATRAEGIAEMLADFIKDIRAFVRETEECAYPLHFLISVTTTAGSIAEKVAEDSEWLRAHLVPEIGQLLTLTRLMEDPQGVGQPLQLVVTREGLDAS